MKDYSLSVVVEGAPFQFQGALAAYVFGRVNEWDERWVRPAVAAAREDLPAWWEDAANELVRWSRGERSNTYASPGLGEARLLLQRPPDEREQYMLLSRIVEWVRRPDLGSAKGARLVSVRLISTYTIEDGTPLWLDPTQPPFSEP